MPAHYPKNLLKHKCYFYVEILPGVSFYEPYKNHGIILSMQLMADLFFLTVSNSILAFLALFRACSNSALVS